MSALRFYFDYISPYAFLAWQQLPQLLAKHALPAEACEPVPVLLGGLLRAYDHKGPAEIPVKRRWVYQDVLRSAAILDIPLRFPPSHPFRPLPALRATCLVAKEAPELLQAFISSLFTAAWQAQQDLADWAVIAQHLQQQGLQLKAAEAEAACSQPEIKALLQQHTEQALAAGVFGVPSFELVLPAEQGRRLLWGHDRLGHLDYLLSHGDPLTDSQLQGLESVPWGL